MERKVFSEAELELVQLAKADDVISTSGKPTKPGMELPTDEW